MTTKAEGASTTATTLGDLVPAHPDRFYDLGIEPWIPVETTAGPANWGFNELLRRSHEVVELRIGDPLERFALQRYLIALTYLALAYDPDGLWDEVADGGPLPEAGVEAVIERMAEQWWLFHPDTPFAQMPLLRSTMSKQPSVKDTLDDMTEGFEVLVPYRPSKSNEAWWYKPDGHGLPFSEAPLVLLSRHYATIAGNEAGVLGQSKTSCVGGLMVCGPQSVTNLLVGFPTLARTLAGNLMTNIADGVTRESPMFFEAPTKVADHLGDPLFLYTASGGGAFLVWPGSDQVITRVLRAPVPVLPASAKALINAARLADPHVLRVKPKADSDDIANPNKGLVAFSATAVQFENVFALYKRGADCASDLRPSVVRPQERFFPALAGSTTLVGVTIQAGGTWTGVRIEAVAQISLDSAPLLLTPEPAHALRILIGQLVDSKKSCLSQLMFHVGKVIAGESRPSDGKRDSLSRAAQTLLWNSLDASVAGLYKTIASSPTGPWPESLPPATKQEWIDQTIFAFNELTAPYDHSPRMRARVAEHRPMLKNALRRQL